MPIRRVYTIFFFLPPRNQTTISVMVWTRKPDGERRDRILRVRVSAIEAALIEEFAAVAGMTLSDYVRTVATTPGRYRLPGDARRAAEETRT